MTGGQVGPASRPGKYRKPLLAVAILIILVFFLYPPVTLLDKSHTVGYAICHQLPARTIHIDGVPLPLCARCTGIYLGTLLTLVSLSLAGRYRFTQFPTKPVLFVLIGFIGLMGIDGVNSYLSFFPGAPYLYEPQNWLRLTTGTLHGLTMGAIVLPIIGQSLWHPSQTRPEPVLSSFKELLLLVAGAGVIILVVLWEPPLLLYPLTFLSTLGVLLMLSMVNTALVLIITRQEGVAYRWGQVAVPAVMGLAVAVLMISGMAGLRMILTTMAGVPL